MFCFYIFYYSLSAFLNLRYQLMHWEKSNVKNKQNSDAAIIRTECRKFLTDPTVQLIHARALDKPCCIWMHAWFENKNAAQNVRSEIFTSDGPNERRLVV